MIRHVWLPGGKTLCGICNGNTFGCWGARAHEATCKRCQASLRKRERGK